MATAHKEAPGTILTVNKDSFEVAASEGVLKGDGTAAGR